METASVKRTIPVTVDKSHLMTIGEKLYAEKISFLRELVNNAYDADATEVHITIVPECITVRDNGSGMDEDGLRRYFTIGASEKRTITESPRLKRVRVGEYGIGKFSALAASRSFEVDTQRGEFHARLIFDKEAWSRHEDWHLDIEILPFDSTRTDGTVIILRDVKGTFNPGTVRRYLAERSPIHAPNFAVLVNGEKASNEITSGRKLPVHIDTAHGDITGLLVIAPLGKKVEQLGIAVSVKQVLIRYEPFGLESSRKWGVARLTGRVNADFLPITSSRDDFLRDTEEFRIFSDAMKKEVGKALGLLREEGDRKANLQASRVLKEAMQNIGKAMKRHAGLFPGAQVPFGNAAGENGPSQEKDPEGYSISGAEFVESTAELPSDLQSRLAKDGKKKKRGRPSAILGDKSVIRHLRVGAMEIAVRMEHLGADEEESAISGGIIFINLDHPLYHTYQPSEELLMIHIARIITKELALTTGVTDASKAFALQTELLTGAFRKR